MTKQLLILCLCACKITISLSQTFLWAGKYGGNDTQSFNAVTADNSYTYGVGGYWLTVDLDPGPGTINYTAVGIQDVMIVKSDAAGNTVWGKSVGGSLSDGGAAVAVDAAGNVFVSGIFNGTADFNPGIGVNNLTSAGAVDDFILKLNASGNYLWAIQIGSTGTEEMTDIITDAAGNIYVSGYFQNTIDFDPGPGVHNETAIGSDASFILKLDNNGNFGWVEIINGTSSELVFSLALDPSGNVYSTGEYWGTCDFDPSVAVYNLTAPAWDSNAFVLKLDNNGNFIWADNIGENFTEFGYDINYDATNQVLNVTGEFNSTTDFNPGAGTFNITTNGLYDGFLLRLHTNGTFISAFGIGGASYDYTFSVTSDASGNIYIPVTFSGSMDADPTAGVQMVTSAGSGDIALVRMNNANTFLGVGVLGGTSDDWNNEIAIDPAGGFIMCGYFSGTVDFDMSTLPGDIYNLSSYAFTWDGYIAKYCNSYTISNDAILCEGDSIYAGGAWQIAEGTYYDYFVPVSGCDSTVITNLSFINLNVALGADIDACIGTTITLDAANPGASYLWNTGATTQTIAVTSSGNYSVTASLPGGCSASDNITVTFHSLPIVNLGADIDICAGETIVLNAGNPGATYLWNTGATTQTIAVIASGNYNVTVTNAFGCSSNDVVHVTVHSLPIVDIGTNYDICAGNTITLNAANPGATYLWNTGATTQTIITSLGGNYFVEVTNAFGCSKADSAMVVIHALPIVSLGADQDVCEGTSVLLNAENPGDNYIWNTGATTQTINVTTTGIYSVNVTDAFGCIGTDAININFNPLPEVDLGADISSCEGSTVTVDAGNIGSTFIWNTGAITQTIDVTISGNYSVTVTNALGCSATDIVHVTFHSLPVVDLGTDISFCDGTVSILNAGNPGADFLWSTGAITQTISVSVSGTYSVLVTNAFGCSSTDAVYVEVYPIPVVDLGSDFSICGFTAIALDAENPGSTFEWSTGETMQNITVADSGTYSVIVTNIFNCTAEDSITIMMHPIPDASISGQLQDTVCLDAADIHLVGDPDGGIFSGAGVSDNYFTAALAGLGDHVVTYIYTDGFGCSDTAQTIVTVVVCTEVKNTDIPTIKIYPNPAMQCFTVETDEPGMKSFILMDATGKSVWQEHSVLENNIQIDVSSFAEGLYFIQVNTVSNSVIEQLVILK